MMYLEFFGLEAEPFHTTPDPYFLYLSSSHKQALGSIIYGVVEKKGFIAVTGQVGLGKTTILRSFLAQIDQTNQHTIYLLNPSLSFRSVLKILLRELGHHPIKGEDAEVVEQLHMVLIEEYQQGRTVVLLIDDAQNMPVATLEHLRMLSNLETPKDKLVQIVLLGQPELDSILDRYELRQIRQRIAVRAMIHPLSPQESVQYIQNRLVKAGKKGNAIFSKSAMRLIVGEAMGVPRRLNIICDNALVTAFGYKKVPVTASIVKEVIRDLSGQTSCTHWRLVPLAAGALILVLAIFMPLTHSQFSDSPLLHDIGQLINHRDNSNQDLLNLEKSPNRSDHGGLSLVKSAQNWLETSVPKVLDTLQEITFRGSGSNMVHLAQGGDIGFENQSDVVHAKKNLIDERKDSTPVVSNEPSNLAVLGGGAEIIQAHENQAPNFPDQSEDFMTNDVQRLPKKETQSVQVKLEPPTDYAVPRNPVYLDPENPDNRSVKMTENFVEEQENGYKKDTGAPITVAKNLGPTQKFSNKETGLVASSLPVMKIMKEGDTLAALMKEVYGSISPSTLRFVLGHNQHIVNVRNISPGQQILFPRLRNGDGQERSVDGAHSLGQQNNEKLGSSKSIFTQGFDETKSIYEKKITKRAAPYAVVIVKEGDTLEKLSKVVYGLSDPLYIQEVLDYNPQLQNSKKISPGQNIAFPRMVGAVNALIKQASQGNLHE